MAGSDSPRHLTAPRGPTGRFGLRGFPRGDYYLGAGPAPAPEKAAASGLVLTYFPGVLAIGKATLIKLKAGETREVEIALKRVPTFEVSGQVIDASERPVSDASVVLSLAEPPTFMRGSVRTNADGTFTLKGVHAGDYGLDVAPPGTRGIADLARLKVTVDGDISNLIVRVMTRPAPAAVPPAAPGRRRLAPVPRHRRRRHRGRVLPADQVERGGRDERALEDADPRAWTVEPDRLGGRHLHLDVDQRQERRESQGRATTATSRRCRTTRPTSGASTRSTRRPAR